MYFLFGIFLVFMLFFSCIGYRRRRKNICWVRSLDIAEKCRILEEIIAPFGYSYVPAQDIFMPRTDAWQREFGYRALYDDAALGLGMVFDSLPVYFDYRGRTWLIELWKGQYGISTGCEIGVYRADRLLAEDERKRFFFQSAGDEELLDLSLTLSGGKRCGGSARAYGAGSEVCQKRTERDAHGSGSVTEFNARPYRLRARHWWLAAFSVGQFSWPGDLLMGASIVFPSAEMAGAFFQGLLKAGCSRAKARLCRNRAAFSFGAAGFWSGHKPGRFARLRLWAAQWKNRLWCRIYLWATRPFSQSIDRLLYLYGCLPFAFRRALRLKRFRKSGRRQA